MTITKNDIKILKSERMNDDADGGGFMTGVVAVDGVENNVFLDISSLDRALGRINLRKVYPAVLTANADTYLGAHFLLDEAPADPAVSAMIFKFGDNTTERAAAMAYAGTADIVPDSGNGQFTVTSAASIGDTTLATSFTQIFTGTPLYMSVNDYIYFGPVNGWKVVTAVNGGSAMSNAVTSIAFAGQPLAAAIGTGLHTEIVLYGSGGTRFYGVALTTIDASVGGTLLTVDSITQKFGNNRVRIIHDAGSMIVVHQTTTEAPQTVTGGQDINLGRTRLADVRVFGNDGVEITTGFAVNRATGHIVFSSVSGYSQPVKIIHRIEDLVGVLTSNHIGKITLNKPLTHDFPTGTRVSAALIVGDLQARVHGSFQQATWTGVWSDTILGGSITADFNDPLYPIVVTNAGAIKERWQIKFTNTTAFVVIGEQVGQIISNGSTAVDCSPINPATGVPYFTIPALGWGTGWAIGNVFRFNTDATNVPIWVVRNVAPSEPFEGQDKCVIAVRGDIDVS